MRFAANYSVIQTVREWIRRQPKDFLKRASQKEITPHCRSIRKLKRASGCFQNIGKNMLIPKREYVEDWHEGEWGKTGYLDSGTISSPFQQTDSELYPTSEEEGMDIVALLLLLNSLRL
ncbi:hypothetical protein AVEN_36092-1, partial [Araneus ventricosus]